MNSTMILVAPCGLYCKECKRYQKDKCPGCHENTKANWCKIRTCTERPATSTCADCTTYSDVNDCSKFNNIFSKFFYYVFKSDRKASLQRISQVGIEKYSQEMKEKKSVVITRK